MEIRHIDVDRIRVSRKYARKISAVKVAQYCNEFENGADFPPIRVVSCGSFYTIRDGRHRFAAQRAAGFTSVPVVVVNTDRSTQLLYGSPVRELYCFTCCDIT